MKPEIKIGQIWGDCADRALNRYLKVEALDETTVHCSTLRTGKSTGIRRSSFKPGSKGYFLAKDADILLEVDMQLAETVQKEPAEPTSTPVEPTATV